MSKSTRSTIFVTTSALIAALYVVLTYIANSVGLASGVIQVRLSEMLCILPYFTPAAIPGLFVGCILANILTGCCALDMVVGSLATLIGAIIARLIRKYKYLVPVPTIVANALLVPFVLIYGYGIKMSYIYLFATVGVGEVISAGIFGVFLLHVLDKIPNFRNMCN